MCSGLVHIPALRANFLNNLTGCAVHTGIEYAHNRPLERGRQNAASTTGNACGEPGAD